MEHIYHKGKYRSGEWCKHLRPFLKRIGNKRWRKDAILEIEMGLIDRDELKPQKKARKRNKGINASITALNKKGQIFSFYRSFGTMEQVRNATRRKSIIQAMVITADGKNLMVYENNNYKEALRNRSAAQH